MSFPTERKTRSHTTKIGANSAYSSKQSTENPIHTESSLHREKSFKYSKDKAASGSNPSAPSRRSHSAHTRGRNASPYSKQRRGDTDTFMDTEDLYDYQKPKKFQLLTHYQAQQQTNTLSKDKGLNFNLPRKTAGPLKALHDLKNFPREPDYVSSFSSDLDGSLESMRSNTAGQFDKLQYQKMDFKREQIYPSEKWCLMLSKYYDDILRILRSKLRENIEMNWNRYSLILYCTEVKLVKSLLENDVTIYDHSSSQQSWLKVEGQKWKYVTDSLQDKFFCIILSEGDLSKTYVCSTATDSQSILSEISKFLDESPIDIEISPHVKEFVKHNEKFFDLHLEEKEIWKISKSRLTELKKEINKVSCQSYLLDDNQYELMCAEKQELLSHIEKEYHVKGSLYRLQVVGDIPVVFQVDQLTNITCVVNSEPENIPVDSLITVDHKVRSFKIHEHTKWESPARQHLHLQGSEYGPTDKWRQCFYEVLAKAFNKDIPSVTIGISLPPVSFDFENICKNLLDALQALCKMSKEPLQRYVILIVPGRKMKSSVEKLLKNPSSLSKASLNYGVSINSFAVKVVQGNLADQQVDVIVNSTDGLLNLKMGNISSSLLKKAGPELQRYCSKSYPRGIIYPDFAVTPGYKLPCKYVIHGALPVNNGDEVIKNFVYRCLEYTEKNRCSSIAFPALGTGVLQYPISQVVKQMDRAFKRFEKYHRTTTLREIRIVLYSEEMELDFSQLDNSPKGLSETEMIQEPTGGNPPKSMNWIQLVNYSCAFENISLAISILDEQQKQPSISSVKILLEEFDDVFFFKDLNTVIPNIVQQLDNKDEEFYYLHLSSETKEKLDALILEVKKNMELEQLNIIQPVSSTVLGQCLLKTRQAFPQVKFIVTNNGQRVIIQSLDWNLTQEAKYFLEIWLGMKTVSSVSENRFDKTNSLMINGTSSFSPPLETQSARSRLDKINLGDLKPAAAASAASSTQGPVKNYVSIQSSQNNPDNSCCFQTENGLIVKVYHGNILTADVDGIVNAANKWLYHGGGVAKAIIDAAGDSVNSEGRSKLNGATLNDGKVLSTSAGNLKRYKNIIHAVGPVYSNNDQYCFEKITSAVNNSLQEAKRLNLCSVALPALSSAIFGVPMQTCVKGYYCGVRMFSENYPISCLKEVHFVDKQELCIKEIQKYFSSYLISITDDSGSPSKPSSATKGGSSSPTEKKADNFCLICQDNMKNPKILEKCKHAFCTDCITQSLKYKPKCPVCKTCYGIETGIQPPGTMEFQIYKFPLPGYEKIHTFWITYRIESPSYRRKVERTAYLPANEEGLVVLKMLQLAFERRLIFTVGESRTTAAQNVVTWNDIHHKTAITGGQVGFGYPDPTYLQRVTEELADHGITPDDVTNRNVQRFLETA